MNKRALSVFLIIIGVSNLAQAQMPTVSGSYENSPLQTAFDDWHEQTGVAFYYQEQWLDSLNLTGTFQQTPLQQAVGQALENTSLSFLIFENRVILSENVIIVTEPALLASFKKGESGNQSIKKGLIFSREYLNQTQDQSDLENYVFEIGNRNNLQNSASATLVGYVKNSENDEPIEGALVYVENPFKGTTTDESGFYSLTLPTGKHRIVVQYVGMKTTHRNIVLFANGKLNVDLNVDVIALQEVTIESGRDENVKNVQMGVNKINVEEVKTVPIVLGENDILKVATTKAGIQTVGEGASGFNVRGGKADQNLLLFNDAPVYNSSHFFGFFSVFNADAVSGMELYKSGIPAKYGGRLSSIFSIESKAANKEEFKGQGGISPITSRLTLEIPLVKDKTSLLVGGRTTYSNWVLKRSKSAAFRENKVSFFDVITRVDHEIDDRNSLMFSSYMSRDMFRLNSDTLFSFSDFAFTNINGSLAWEHRFGNDLDAKFSVIHARYGYELNYDESLPNAFVQDFGTNETSLKADFEYYREDQHKISFGTDIKSYRINPGTKQPLGSESLIAPEIIAEDRGLETALYFSDKYEFNEQLSLYGGLRYVIFSAMGSATIYEYEPGLPKNGDTQIDSAVYNSGEIMKTYHGPEWRFSARYSLDNASSAKFSLSRTRQYIHTLSNSASLSPTDTWRLSGPHLKPQTADQISLGYYRNFLRGTIEVSAEGYYKQLQNLVDFKTGSTFLLNQNLEQVVLQGPGKSYGLELSVNKSGRLNGWINYAYARTFIKLDGNFSEERVNEGQYFPTAYDKPHTVNLVANYKLTRRLSFSINTTYNTGRPVTVPVAAFNFRGAQNIHFSDRNAYRIPDYFRIDLGVNLEGNHKISKLAHSFWSLSIYNLTGRDNPFSVFFDVKDGEVIGSQLIVFGNPIPTLSYNFKF